MRLKPIAKQVEELLSQMVQIPSINPYESLPDNQLTGERQLAEWVANWLEVAGLEVKLQEVLPDRPNVIARLKGRDSSHALLLSGHLDTVENHWTTGDPFSGQLRGGRIYGLGSCDAKGSLTAFMLALHTLQQEKVKPPIDIILAAVIDEEHRARGTQHFLEQWDPSCRIVGSVVGLPTELAMVTSHKGGFVFTVTTSGRSVHSAISWGGDNAIERMNQVMDYLRDEVVEDLNRKVHPLVGAPSIAMIAIHGGQSDITVPNQCQLKIMRWLIPGEDVNLTWPRYKVEIEALAPGRIEVSPPENSHPPMNTPVGTNLVRCLSAILDRRGYDYHPVGSSYSSDAGALSLQGISCILFGPGSMIDAHQHNESIEVQQVALARDILRELAVRFEEWDR